jgi:hypothetical protein
MARFTPEILERLGLDHTATEDQILKKLEEIAQRERLEARAAAEGKVVLGKAEHDRLKRRAVEAEELAEQVRQLEQTHAASRAGRDVPVDELLNDPYRLDDVVRALEAARGSDYISALHELTDAAKDARLVTPDEPVMLSAVLAKCGTTLDVVVGTEQQHRTFLLDSAASTPMPTGQRDAQGNVLIPASVDLDELLADPVAPRKAWRAYQQFLRPGHSWTFKSFEPHWRTNADNGIDYVATEQARRSAQEAADNRRRAQEQRNRQIRMAREKRVRQLEREAEEAAERVAGAKAPWRNPSARDLLR